MKVRERGEEGRKEEEKRNIKKELIYDSLGRISLYFKHGFIVRSKFPRPKFKTILLIRPK